MEERKDILRYFHSLMGSDDFDPGLYELLSNHITDVKYPFQTVKYLAFESNVRIDIKAFLGMTSILNKFIIGIGLTNPSPRAVKFLWNHNKDYTLKPYIDSLIMSTYVGEKIVDDVVEDDRFITFLNNGEDRIVIMDVANIYNTIIRYEGDNEDIITLRDVVIRDRSLYSSMYDMIRYIIEDLNYLNYKLICVCNNLNHDNIYEDRYCIINVDCQRYTGDKCGKDYLTNEADDVTIMMLYYFCKYIIQSEVSIMSQDNYDFAFVSTDYHAPIPRVIFGMDGIVGGVMNEYNPASLE